MVAIRFPQLGEVEKQSRRSGKIFWRWTLTSKFQFNFNSIFEDKFQFNSNLIQFQFYFWRSYHRHASILPQQYRHVTWVYEYWEWSWHCWKLLRYLELPGLATSPKRRCLRLSANAPSSAETRSNVIDSDKMKTMTMIGAMMISLMNHQ